MLKYIPFPSFCISPLCCEVAVPKAEAVGCFVPPGEMWVKALAGYFFMGSAL
jgi:hypothetical protein